MEIKTIEIKNIMGGRLRGDKEGLRHIKSLPCLSVVQPLHGCYEIALGGGAPVVTEEGGAFVAPAGVPQNILHRNGTAGYMEAHWVFMQVTVNGLFDLEDVFELPGLLPSVHREQLQELIFTAANAPTLCSRYATAYQLTELLLTYSIPKKTAFDHAATLLKRYIEEHYRERITKEQLAEAAVCSMAGLYRIFQKHFYLSPHNYINKVRLEKASVLLESGDRTVGEIAEAVGFEDPVYFSRLFKENYGLSPKKYREITGKFIINKE